MWVITKTMACMSKLVNGGCIIIKTSSYQCRDVHYKDKTVLPLSYLYNGTHTWQRVFILKRGPGCKRALKDTLNIFARLHKWTPRIQICIAMVNFMRYSLSEYCPSEAWTLFKLEIVDQWSTRIPPPSRWGSSGQCVGYNWTSFKITRLLSTYTHG